MLISKRPATEADHEFARGVHHRAYRDVIERQYGAWDDAAQDQLFDDVWVAANHEIILCDKIRCGYCGVENRPRDILLRELVIDPVYQGRGIGTHVLHETLRIARTRDVPVRLRTQLLNSAAVLYRRLGFRETGRTERHILMEWRAGEEKETNAAGRGTGTVQS